MSQPVTARDAYAIDRTVLANERTYAAWIRTGLAALAAGVAAEGFVVGVMPDWTIRAIAAILILFAATAFALAAWRYSHLGVALAEVEVKAIPAAVTTIVSAFLVACAVLALIGLWGLDPVVAQ